MKNSVELTALSITTRGSLVKKAIEFRDTVLVSLRAEAIKLNRSGLWAGKDPEKIDRLGIKLYRNPACDEFAALHTLYREANDTVMALCQGHYFD